MKIRYGILSTMMALLLFTFSCTESKTSSTEEIEIKTMDSTSKVVKEKTDELEDQTKKVERSLEKLDDEFSEN